MMETHKLVIILILYCIGTVFGYPPRPLNERSPDLTWQAWLLVDDQNQNRQHGSSDGMLRRRITPKSVFIAPTFSPESFPACADGYSSDPMGRCIKIIKLDQDAHYEFLIEKLKQKFSSFDYEDDDEDEVVETTTGPLQLNIPLNVDSDDSRLEESGQETDVAIIVSPTKPFDFKTYNFDKRSSVEDEAKQEVLLKKLAAATTKTEREVTVVTPQLATKHSANANTTTVATTTTNEATTTDVITTTSDVITEESTIVSTETEETTVTIITSTGDSTTVPTTIEQTTTVVTQSPKPEDASTLLEEELHAIKFNITTLAPPTVKETQTTFVRFPNEAPVRTRVKFPDSPRVSSSLDHITAMNNENFRHHNGRTVIINEKPEEDQRKRSEDNHKSLFMIPPRWSTSSFQKPLVLRFSRKHAFMDKSQFNYPNYYRSIPPDDFEYLFKFKNRQ